MAKKHCVACEKTFKWSDDVVVVDDEIYHENCLTLFPSGYVAFLDGEFIGETENEDGQMAIEILDEGEYEGD